MSASATNPFLVPYTELFEMPPFRAIKLEHFLPAFDAGMVEGEAEIARIAGQAAPATFANTIDALEVGGEILRRVSSVFFNLSGTDTTPQMQALERDIVPKLTGYRMRMYQNEALWRRIDALMTAKDSLGLTGEQIEVLKRYHRAFVKSGAKLDASGKARLKAIAERLSTLTTNFSQNVLKDEQSYTLVLDGEKDLVGLSPSLRAVAQQTATERGMSGKHVITLSRSSIEPFLEYSDRRDLREKAFKAWSARGSNGGDTDNRVSMAEILALRNEQAKLLGFKSFADSSLEFTMAKKPDAVRELLMNVWPPARARAMVERDALQQRVAAEGGNFAIAAWDWRYYSEKVRKAKYDLDASAIKPYLQLDRMIDAAFDCATRLFGLTFAQRPDIPAYNPEVRVYEVKDKVGRHVGLFLGDYFARPSKRSGAWMTAFRGQSRLTAGRPETPIIINVMNFTKAAPGEPALLSMDDARTLFHEFGHGLHGLLSNVTYPSVAGTSVSRDFVELPSQLYEHWLAQPEVLKKFARHAVTGDPMPDAMIERLAAARNFNQGFSTVEYLASSLFDLAAHTLENADGVNIDQLETKTLKDIGMPAEITMRHRPAHFQHIIGGYAAGYYSYMWSEVLDADAFRAFEERGDIFDPGVAKRLHDHIYSAGGRQDATDAYLAFRGKLPAVDALLAKRGLDGKAASG